MSDVVFAISHLHCKSIMSSYSEQLNMHVSVCVCVSVLVLTFVSMCACVCVRQWTSRQQENRYGHGVCRGPGRERQQAHFPTEQL